MPLSVGSCHPGSGTPVNLQNRTSDPVVVGVPGTIQGAQLNLSPSVTNFLYKYIPNSAWAILILEKLFVVDLKDRLNCVPWIFICCIQQP